MDGEKVFQLLVCSPWLFIKLTPDYGYTNISIFIHRQEFKAEDPKSYIKPRDSLRFEQRGLITRFLLPVPGTLIGTGIVAYVQT